MRGEDKMDKNGAAFPWYFEIGGDGRLFVMQDNRGWNLAISTDNREGVSLKCADPYCLRELAAWANKWANTMESQES